MESLEKSKKDAWLPWFYRGILFVFFAFLFARLIDLQIIKGKYFKSLSDENRIRRVTIDAARGKILSRNGRTLADNKIIERAIIFDPKEGYLKEDTWSNETEKKLIKETIRFYPISEFFAHLGGFINEANENEVGRISQGCEEKGIVVLGQKVGRGGIEQKYDCVLRGINGEMLIEIEAGGKKIRDLGMKDPIAGQDIKTNIDYDLQIKISELMKDKKGAVIVSDFNSNILAMFSSPSFDPNRFNSKIDKEYKNQILKRKDLPFFNRAISGTYPPGSIFKPLVLIAAFSEGSINKDFTFLDEGFIEIKTIYGSFRYDNWYFTQYGRVEGEVDAKKALARSTDTFFYKVGEILGVKKLAKWGEIFGLNEITGIDLPGEVSGIVPNPEWKKKTKGEKWFLGNTYHLSIGQGDLLVTPIGIHQALSSIAGRGKLCKPQIVFSESKICKDLNVSDDVFDFVQDAMVQACSQGGTGFTFFEINEKNPGRVACKTGTAETFDDSEPHSWFYFFTNGLKENINVTVLVENGGEGSKVAGSVAREIYDFWVNGG